MVYVYISHVGVSTVDPIHGLTLPIAYWYIGPHVEGLLYLLLIYLNTKHMIKYEIIWLFLWYLDGVWQAIANRLSHMHYFSITLCVRMIFYIFKDFFNE